LDPREQGDPFRVACQLTVSFCPGGTFDDLEKWWTSRTRAHPQTSVATQLSSRVPASVADRLLERAGIDSATTLAHFAREDRRRLNALVKWPLAVTSDRGFNYAQVTAGGVSLGGSIRRHVVARVRACARQRILTSTPDRRVRLSVAWSSARVAAGAIGT
jgi:hypothetical protein